MKDLEKIKSEDLGCQVQDANPGNFAIEQEVAQLVGATVPAPTEPSADDARELPAQLQVFLRRALTPIQLALRTALAAIYSHLDSRCTAYTPAAYAPYIHRPYDPMGTPPTPRSVANLLTAITAFSARKISNGSAPNDGIPDGVSLAHLLCEPASVTTLVDDNSGWDNTTANRIDTLKSLFPNVVDITLRCKTSVKLINNPALSINQPSLPELETTALPSETFINGQEEWYLPKIKSFTGGMSASDAQLANLKKMNFPELESIGEGVSYPDFFYQKSFPNLEEMYFPNLKRIKTWGTARTLEVAGETTKFWRLVLGKLEYLNAWSGGVQKVDLIQQADLNLIDVEIGAGTAISFSLAGWNPTNVLSDADKTATFLQNFKEHIALRLTSNGSGKTLTLSQAVFDTIWKNQTSEQPQDNPIAQQIHQIIRVQKHWAVNRA